MSCANVGQSLVFLTVRMKHGFNVFGWSCKGEQCPGLGTFHQHSTTTQHSQHNNISVSLKEMSTSALCDITWTSCIFTDSGDIFFSVLFCFDCVTAGGAIYWSNHPSFVLPAQVTPNIPFISGSCSWNGSDSFSNVVSDTTH